MRILSFIILSICSSLTFAQNLRNVHEYKVIYLVRENGDSIKVTGTTYENLYDTAYLRVTQISHDKTTILQNIKTPYYYPLELTKCPSNYGNGFYITYDPGVKNGNKFLYLFNEKINRFSQVKEFINLGQISELKINDLDFYYSYSSCGCADNCWKSLLFKVQQYQIDTLGFLSCDCSSLIKISRDKKKSTVDNCDEFNNLDKFKKIAEYWTEKIKNGL
jgi:hypothetical protein